MYLDVNKKVLLRERKRHTARCVANTRHVVLTGYPPPGGGVPGQVPSPPGGYPDPPGVPGQVPPPGGVWVPPPGGYPARYPPGGSPFRYPPRGGPGTPRGVPSQVPPRGGTRTLPLPPCGQTNTCENSTFPSYYVRGR